LINGTFLLSPKGEQKNMCFVFKFHIDDEFLPKLMAHLQESNNLLTMKWNIGTGDDTDNLIDCQAKVSLPKKEGRNFVLRGVPATATKDSIQELLQDHGIHAKDIRPKGRLEGMADKENFNGTSGQFGEWIVKVDYSLKPVKTDIGVYEDERGRFVISLSPLHHNEEPVTPIKVPYPARPMSYRNVLTNQQNSSPSKTWKLRQNTETVLQPTSKSGGDNVIPETEIPQSPRKTRKRTTEESNEKGKMAKSPRKLPIDNHEEDPRHTRNLPAIMPSQLGVYVDPGPSIQQVTIPEEVQIESTTLANGQLQPVSENARQNETDIDRDTSITEDAMANTTNAQNESDPDKAQQYHTMQQKNNFNANNGENDEHNPRETLTPQEASENAPCLQQDHPEQQ
jgi:hypothetical protein